MDLETAIRERRSIRAYKPDPVPQDLIREILDEARWSPSWANTQCWHVHAVTGKALKRIKAALREAERDAAPAKPDFRMQATPWPEAQRERTQALMKEIMAARRTADGETGAPDPYDFFGAPCLLLADVDTAIAPDYACFDAGLFTQTLCLAAHARGLGTCIMARTVRRPEVLRSVLPRTDGRSFVIAIALGWPDPKAPINAFPRERAPLAESVTWSDA